jgi:ribosomal protein S18 acetylase RimI-like enzyme
MIESTQMTFDIIIRHATPADLPAMEDIWIEFIDFHAARDPFFTRAAQGHERFRTFVAERLTKDDWRVLVAVVDDEVVGHIVGALQSHPPVFVQTTFGYVQDIAVRGSFRRHGIGRRLFERLEVWFKESGVTRIELDAAAANDTSQRFWRAMGCSDFMVRLTKPI